MTAQPKAPVKNFEIRLNTKEYRQLAEALLTMDAKYLDHFATLLNLEVQGYDSGKGLYFTGHPSSESRAKKAFSDLSGLFIMHGKMTLELVEQGVKFSQLMKQDNEASTADKKKNEHFNLVAQNQNMEHGFNPRTDRQKEHAQTTDEYQLSFITGPAGGGKTHVTLAKAIKMYRDGKIEKIIVARPAVDMGNGLGFVPGTDEEKLATWLSGIFRCLNKILGSEAAREAFLKEGALELCQLTKVRGDTFEDKTFFFLDEAQNCKYKELFTIMTRIGEGAKAVFAGDYNLEQIDLEPVSLSGFKEIVEEFSVLDKIGVCEYTEEDCTRSALVKDILLLRRENKEKKAAAEAPKKLPQKKHAPKH